MNHCLLPLYICLKFSEDRGPADAKCASKVQLSVGGEPVRGRGEASVAYSCMFSPPKIDVANFFLSLSKMFVLFMSWEKKEGDECVVRWQWGGGLLPVEAMVQCVGGEEEGGDSDLQRTCGRV